jgi:hypothetical protein
MRRVGVLALTSLISVAVIAAAVLVPSRLFPVTAASATATALTGQISPASSRPLSCLVPTSLPPTSSTTTTAPTGPAFPVMQWKVHTVVSNAAPQVVDTKSNVAYAMSLPLDSDATGNPGHVQRISLSSGRIRSGPSLRVGSLTLAAGSLWAAGSMTASGTYVGAILCQLNPESLRLVRQVTLPDSMPNAKYGYEMPVTAGPGHSIWVGYGSQLTRLSSKGAVITHRTLPSGDVDSLAIDPSQHHLYVSLGYPTIAGKQVDAQVDELDARTGAILATTNATSDVTFSVAGGALTGLPDGVSDSFRTGMAGEALLLDRSSLTPVNPLGMGSDAGFTKPPGDVFSWFMADSTIYGGGSLWIENEDGVFACVNPLNGKVRAVEHTKFGNGGGYAQLIAVNSTHHLVYADSNGSLVTVTPPGPCWS